MFSVNGPNKSETMNPEKAKAFDPVDARDKDGVRYLRFGTEWIQGAMRLSRPDWLELEYVRMMMAWMLLAEEPKKIALLGLGAGSFARFCHKRFPDSAIEAVEFNPQVVRICKELFLLPPESERFAITLEDAGLWVLRGENSASCDIMLVDVYDAQAEGPALESEAFYAGVSRCLAPGGMAMVNLFGGHPSYERNIQAMAGAFSFVAPLPECHSGNIIAMCANHALAYDAEAMAERAEWIYLRTGLPAGAWMEAMEKTLPESASGRGDLF